MDEEIDPFFMGDLAPMLPHFGRAFVFHGPSGVSTFEIRMQKLAYDGLVMLGGFVLHGTDVYENGYSVDLTGEQLWVFVTLDDYLRLTNAPEVRLH